MKSNFVFIEEKEKRRKREREREREKSIIYLKDTASKTILDLDVCILNCKKIS